MKKNDAGKFCINASMSHNTHPNQYYKYCNFVVILNYSKLKLNSCIFSDFILFFLGHIFLLYNAVTSLSFLATNCNRHISSADGKNGTITSPNYPNPYPGDITCRFTFEGSGPERVQLRFTHMDLYFPGGNAADPHE